MPYSVFAKGVAVKTLQSLENMNKAFGGLCLVFDSLIKDTGVEEADLYQAIYQVSNSLESIRREVQGLNYFEAHYPPNSDVGVILEAEKKTGSELLQLMFLCSSMGVREIDTIIQGREEMKKLKESISNLNNITKTICNRIINEN